ncbi:MAG: arginine--tRNA ligase, partial [Candidatus Azambacteria bacterium]|nr:arginine--tRNA ligase [Candidatus Azambacteria bacterium]
MKELIKTCFYDIIRKLNPDFRGDILVEIPENKEHGDYTTNVAFKLAKIINKSPQAVAEELVKKLNSQKISDFSRIEPKNGFVNFFLSEKRLYRELGEILKRKNKYGELNVKGQMSSVNVEFISANPTGPLTIGNGRGGFYGDTLANILESQGYKVTREYYINDRGEQILSLGRSIKLAQKASISETIPTNASSVSEITEQDNVYKGEYINELAKKINKNLNESEVGQKAVELILKTYIKPAIKRLGIKFDFWFSEKSLYRGAKYEKIMEDLMQKDFIYEKDGATWMKTSELGDSEDRVLIKKDGSETYFLSDILYHFDKFKIRKFDKVIDIWGADHHGYAPR